jgi:NADH-quinone oxidoreductase subunit N
MGLLLIIRHGFLMNLTAFAVTAQVERRIGSDGFDALSGLGQRAPWAAAALALAVLSLAGIPPLAGFAGKVFLLIAAIDGGIAWLAVVAAVNMAIALYYYAVIVAEMYFRKPKPTEAVAAGVGYAWAVGLCTAGTIVLGVVPNLGLNLARLGSQILQ